MQGLLTTGSLGSLLAGALASHPHWQPAAAAMDPSPACRCIHTGGAASPANHAAGPTQRGCWCWSGAAARLTNNVWNEGGVCWGRRHALAGQPEAGLVGAGHSGVEAEPEEGTLGFAWMRSHERGALSALALYTQLRAKARH